MSSQLGQLGQRRQLGQRSRDAALTALATEIFDVLVVGAGATGCGTALDAAARGLKVALIDKGDIASGTSSKSSKLVHGGLRYLQQGNVALVREALRERDLLLRTLAPHLVTPLPFILPLRHRFWERAYMGTGLLAYDIIGGSNALPRHRQLSKKHLLKKFPSLRSDAFIGGMQFYDGQMDDARLAVAIARTAADHGAAIATYVSLTGVGDTDTQGLHHVTVRDQLTGTEVEVTARSIALCVGVWAPEVARTFARAEPAEHADTVNVTQSKGVHLRLPRSAITGETALLIPTEKSVLFVIPSPDHWLIGTTDTEWNGSPDRPEASQADVDYLLNILSGVLSRPITTADVTYVFAGLRPLVRDVSLGGDTAKVSREHRITRLAPGVLAMVGGKWTTYRVMARDLVDAVLVDTGLTSRRCTTDTIALVGSGPLDSTVTTSLQARYGSCASEVTSIIEDTPELGNPLTDAPGYLRAEIVHACVSEGALTLADVMDRRMRFGLHLDQVTPALIDEVAALMGDALHWKPDEAAGAAAEYRALSATP